MKKPARLWCVCWGGWTFFYADLPNMDAEGLGRKYQETFKSELCPTKERYSVQIPIEVKEESAIFECKDGKYMS